MNRMYFDLTFEDDGKVETQTYQNGDGHVVIEVPVKEVLAMLDDMICDWDLLTDNQKHLLKEHAEEIEVH